MIHKGVWSFKYHSNIYWNMDFNLWYW